MKKKYKLGALASLCIISMGSGQRLGTSDSFFSSRLCGKINCQLVKVLSGQLSPPPTNLSLKWYQYATDLPNVGLVVTRIPDNNKIIKVEVYSNSRDSQYEDVFSAVAQSMTGYEFKLLDVYECLDQMGDKGSYEYTIDKFHIGCEVYGWLGKPTLYIKIAGGKYPNNY